MVDRTRQVAETVVAATSRRGSLKRISRFAGGVAAGMAGLLAASSAQAGKPQKKKMCCVYISRHHALFLYRCVNGNKCPQSWRGAELYGASEVTDCAYC